MAKHKMIGALLVMVLILTCAGCTTPPQVEVAPAAPVAAATPAAATVPPASELARLTSPAEIVVAFYTWYLDYIGQTGSDTMRNPLVDGAYRTSPYLTPDFVQHVDELLASFAGGGYDPFLCAQDVPAQLTPDVVFTRNGMASVVVHSSFPNHLLTVDLRPEGDVWLIGNITCAVDPAGVAKAFYTWYLGYIGDRASGDFRNPLVDQAYQGHPLLSEDLVQEVDALIAGFEQGSFDPFLLAQDIPQDFSVDPGVAPGTAIVHLQFGPDSVRHLLVTVDDSGREIAAIAVATGMPGGAPAGASQGGSAFGARHSSDEYGFSLSYPAGWVLQAQQVGGPGAPEDWPVEAAWLLMPQEVAAALASQGSPPDPNAPIIVAPFQIEAVVGDEQAVERVYYNFREGKRATVGSREAVVLRSDPGYANYVFRHPQRSDTWIVVTDWVTEFPGREVQAASAAPVLPGLLASVAFHDNGDQGVPVPDGEAQGPPTGSITIEAVQVDGEHVMVRGRSTLPDGTCLGSELWADGELVSWWPGDACARVDRGVWQLVVPLGAGRAPGALDPSVQYMLQAFLPGGPNIVSVFAFDLAGPPAQANP